MSKNYGPVVLNHKLAEFHKWTCSASGFRAVPFSQIYGC
jgi:hypothetical protein